MPNSCQKKTGYPDTAIHSRSVPATAVITDLQVLSQDTILLRVQVPQPALTENCAFTPGQFVQISVPAGGEIPISVAGMPLDNTFDLCIRKVGHVTSMAHHLKPGDRVGIRGPFGSGFPVAKWVGRDILLIGGGLGIAPLRALLLHLLAHRSDFGTVTLMYGARDPSALLFREELFQLSCRGGFKLLLTVDFVTGEMPQELICRTGLVTDLLSATEFDTPDSITAICGPPALYRCVIPILTHIGIQSEKMYLSLERRMKCGIGICCHCAVGDLFCCTDGPVFSYAQLQHISGAL